VTGGAAAKGASARALACRLFGAASSVVLLALAVLTFIDVCGRYLFNRPVYGAYEIVEILMAALIFTALPVVTLTDRHITIDLLDTRTPPSLARLRDLIVNIVSAVAMAVIAWQLAVLGKDKAMYGDVTTFLRIPQAPVIYGMAVLAAFSSLAAIAAALIGFSSTRRS